MQYSQKFSLLLLLLVFTASRASQVPVKPVPIQRTVDKQNFWLPPSQFELQARRAGQSQLDAIAEKIGNLYLSHDQTLQYVQGMSASLGEWALRLDGLQPEIELAAI